MSDFIKKQQELGRKQYWEKLDGKNPHLLTMNTNSLIDTLIQQIITNTGEELLRWLEAEVVMALNEGDLSRKEGLERAIEHINSLTGAK